MSSFEIASQVTRNYLPILPSIFGLSTQNIVISHYSCHSVSTKVKCSYGVPKFKPSRLKSIKFSCILLKVSKSQEQYRINDLLGSSECGRLVDILIGLHISNAKFLH